jgi:hypothetical protein
MYQHNNDKKILNKIKFCKIFLRINPLYPTVTPGCRSITLPRTSKGL